jgi:hypothetical protein
MGSLGDPARITDRHEVVGLEATGVGLVCITSPGLPTCMRVGVACRVTPVAPPLIIRGNNRIEEVLYHVG